MSVALLAEGVGRNTAEWRRPFGSSSSPSSRRAWVEIHLTLIHPRWNTVALLAEGVGRNLNMLDPDIREQGVALLAEGVGRNRQQAAVQSLVNVALLAEGVGRN